MAKMRGIKPETFTDDKVLQVEPLARWLFVGMWTQACDNGHIEDNHVQLKVRILPMDNCDVSDLVRQLVKVGLLDQHDGFLKIPNLSTHQKIDKRYLVFCKWCEHDKNSKCTEGEGEGEGENNTSDSANAEPRPDIESVLDRIDQHCAEHDFKKPNRTKQNLNAARLMLDKDERTLEQVNWIMDWVTAHSFWASNIMSASKLREKFDQLKGQALSNRQPAQHMTSSQRRLQEGYEREQRILNGELSFDNPDNPYLQPRPPRQAIEGGNPWTTEQP